MVEYKYNPELINIIYIILIILFKSYKSIASVSTVSPVCNFVVSTISSYNLVLMMYNCFTPTIINIKIIVMMIIICK